ncbi:conserved hypothetical protein [gamma proteobacterium HdN1]|nr:conserved hypothetical protein [gamma proteobacterium HdN1]
MKPIFIALIAATLAALPTLSNARVEPQTPDEQPIVPSKRDKVTIVQNADQTIEIHQIDGKIYGIKVVPKHGKPYFLVDLNGDGNFIQNSSDRMLVPQWVIKSW